MSDRTYIEKLEEENKYLKSLLQKKSFVYEGKEYLLISEFKGKKNEIKIEEEGDITSSDVEEEFATYFEDVEFSLPEKDKLKLFQMYCSLFQISFDFCRNAFIEKLKEPLFALTELSHKENRTNEVDLNRKKKLVAVSRAYEFLLKHSSAELRIIDYSVIEKVKTSFCVRHEGILPEIDDKIIKAVKMCWKMQLVPTPMFVCQPKAFNDKWHDTYYENWDEDNKSTNELVYYRPVLMNCVGGTLASKGLVGNRQGTDFLKKKKEKKLKRIIIYQGSGKHYQQPKDIRSCLAQGFIQQNPIRCTSCERVLLKEQFCIGENINFLHEKCFYDIISE